MRIESAVVREIEAVLRAPFRSVRGTVAKRRVLLVTLRAEGLEAWSECVAGVDTNSTESVERAWEALTDVLLPNVVGKRFHDPELNSFLLQQVEGCWITKIILLFMAPY